METQQIEIRTKTVGLVLRRMDGTETPTTNDGIAEQVRAGMLVMETMDVSGDVKKIWDPSRTDEVADAKRSFEDLKRKGYRAYRVSEGGNQGEPMDTFDEKAGRVLMVPAMQGG
jgi:hypothetical protein